ncbi:spindle assembly checkpoint kinase [Cordyceps militaris]|uniref:EKC/KEOPS complex subunit BUD32 n=1 Tax=Cordyceps militaris TaxID=73501 RepID=A0A2H4SAS6_CORMI|nr:spindle assembly checkpoint kinase [Cordyceps militaris]
MDYVIQFPDGITSKDVLGMGTTALVARLDAVIKFCDSSQLPMLERERRVYERLGDDHDGILRYHGRVGDALVLQYACHGSIRQFRADQTKPTPLPLQLRWIEQITTSVAFIHSKAVLHGDISCNNVLLMDDLDAKLADFAGSSIDGEEPLICYETSHEQPHNTGISTASELFALGSTFYEIMAGKKPYEGWTVEDIALAYREGRFPSVENLPAFGLIIHRCWNQGYESVDALLKDVKLEGMIFSEAEMLTSNGFQSLPSPIPLLLAN